MTSTYEHVLMYYDRCTGVKPILAAALAVVLAVSGSDASAKPTRRHHHAPPGTSAHASGSATGTTGSGLPFSSDDDALYRAHGYGIGGVPFSLGGGPDLALSGACAQVANRNPACGPAGGYGIYGNGLSYGSGAR